jgi:hypothetical protein
MSKKRKKIIKKVNSFKKQLKTNLSLLKTHIYNYKLEILLSVLIIVVIFLIALIYPSSYIALDTSDNSSNNEVSKNTDTNNVGQSIDEYLAGVLKDNDDNDNYSNDENYSAEDFREEEGVNDNSERDNNETNDSTSNNNINEDIDNLEPEPEEDNNNLSNAFVNSFGDSFTSSAYLNLDETNMYLDDISTALTFEPLYDFSKVGSCGGVGDACNFKKDVRILDYGMEACIKDTNNCLKVINESLYYNGTELELPEKIKGKELTSLTLGALETKFLLGAVLAQGADEYGLVYSFDGSDFESIISATSKYNIKSKYQRQGGRIGFGGSDNNYIILYAGYNSSAFQVVGDEIIDISQMFGLRVTNKGFMPQILQSGSGSGSTWYVCSLDKTNPKFIKLWQNNTPYIQGSLDLSYDIYGSGNLYDNFDYCYLSENDDNKVYLTFNNKRNNSINNKSLDIWQFQDNGFDNSQDYLVVSVNLLDRKDYVAKNATLKDIGLSAAEKGYTDSISSFGDLYLGYINTNSSSTSELNDNNKYNWQEVTVGRSLSFPEPVSNLYWRLDLKAKDKHFSPWFDHLNRLNYLLMNN